VKDTIRIEVLLLNKIILTKQLKKYLQEPRSQAVDETPAATPGETPAATPGETLAATPGTSSRRDPNNTVGAATLT
jgi:hypothetical protein